MSNPKKFKGASIDFGNAKRGSYNLIEEWGGKSNRLHRPANATRTTTVSSTGQKTNSAVTYQPGQLTKTGKGVVATGVATTGGGAYYMNRRRDRKPVVKSFWGVEHGDEVSKEYDPKKSFRKQGMAYKNKGARKRVVREISQNGAYYSPRGKHRKENWKTAGKHAGVGTAGGAALGAGVGAAFAAKAKIPVKPYVQAGTSIGGLTGLYGGGLTGSVAVANRAAERGYVAGRKRKDIVRRNYKRFKLSPVND